MGIEASDIADSSIMDATTIAAVGQGYQFSTTLPSGRFVQSEVVAAGDKAKAGLIWVATIKQEIVADSEKAEIAARRAARASKRARVDTTNVPTEVPGLPVPGQIFVPDSDWPANAPKQAFVTRVAGPSVIGDDYDTDPNIFIISQRNAARSEYSEAEMDLASAKTRLAKARQAAAKWDAIYSSIVGDKGDEAKISNYSVDPKPVGIGTVEHGVLVFNTDEDANSES